MSHILIVEDETIIRSALRRLLERNQYEVSEAGSVQEAQERYSIPFRPHRQRPATARRTRHRTDQTGRRHTGADHDQLRQPALGGGLHEDGRGGLHRQALRPRRNAADRGAHPSGSSAERRSPRSAERGNGSAPSDAAQGDIGIIGHCAPMQDLFSKIRKVAPPIPTC